MNITLNGIILRAVNYKESDKILTVLSDDLGKITVKAQGARRKGSKYMSISQPFCYSEMTLFEKDGRYSINEGFVREQFYGLCQDIEKMALASYFAAVIESEEAEDTPLNNDVMRLALNSFYALERALYPAPIIKAAFELRYMAMCGYSPDIPACASCGDMGHGGYINTESGMLFCKGCLPHPTRNDYFLDEEALLAARYVLSCDIQRLFSFKLPEKSMADFMVFTEGYLIAKTERSYKTLDFYRSLFDIEGVL